MTQEATLSLPRQASGRRRYLTFTIFNSASFYCQGDSVLILLAVAMGCADYVIAMMSSFVFLCNFTTPVGKTLVARVGSARTIGLTWIARNGFVLLIVLAPFAATMFSRTMGLALLLVGAFGSYSARSIGLAGFQPLLGEITNGGNRGRFTASVWFYFCGVGFLTLAAVIGVLRWRQGLGTYQAIMTFGAILGFVGGYIMSGVEETDAPRRSAAKPVLGSLKTLWANPTRRRHLYSAALCSTGIMLVVPISMLALKRGYEVADATALCFALAQLVGGAIVSYFNRVISEETGPRPLVILYFVGLIVIAGLWIFAPAQFSWFHAIFVFTLAGIFSSGAFMSLTHYFLNTVPRSETVAMNLFLTVSSGICAGAAGFGVSGFLLKFLGDFHFATPLDLFRVYFLIIAGILILLTAGVRALEPVADWKLTDVLGLAFAPKDMMSLFVISRAKEDDSTADEKTMIDRLEGLGSSVSEKALRQFLDSPDWNVRGKAAMAFRTVPFGQNTAAMLIDLLKTAEYTTGYIAAMALGDAEIKEAIPALRETLRSADSLLRAKSMVALAQLGDKPSFAAIVSLFRDADEPRTVINGAMAMAEIADPIALRALLDKAVEPDLPDEVRNAILYAINVITGIGDEFHAFMKMYPKESGGALESLVEYLGKLSETPLAANVKTLILGLNGPAENLKAAVDELARVGADNPVRVAPAGLRSFLNDTPTERLYPELVCCLFCAVRKSGGV